MEEKTKTEDVRDKFKDIIIAWANGSTIQFKSNENSPWMDIESTPIWDSTCEYRVKPVVTKKYFGISVDEDGDIVYNNSILNVEVEVEDGVIKSISLLKEPKKNDNQKYYCERGFITKPERRENGEYEPLRDMIKRIAPYYFL